VKVSHALQCLPIAFGCLWFTHAFADDQDASVSAAADNEWKVSVGPGLMLSPRYPGARELRLLPIPSLDISYDDRIYSQGLDLIGVNVLKGKDEAYHVGAALSLDFQSRSESDDPHLRGLGNVDEGPKLKLFADYSVSFLTGSVAAYQDIAGTGQGLLVSADLLANLPLTSRFLVSFGPGTTWANAEYTRSLFGVSATQSAASGLPAFNTSAGLRDVHLNAYASYDIAKKWVGSLAVTVGRLQHDAAHSPITERRDELNVVAAINYRFR
jgi:outer membrane scaffolding protein for murein synthesis (MipA/OmpV family)